MNFLSFYKLLNLTDLDNIADSTYIESEELKARTFRAGSLTELGNEVYQTNLLKILKYQIKTNGNDSLLYKTLFHLYSSITKTKNKENYEDYILLGIISFFILINSTYYKNKESEDYKSQWGKIWYFWGRAFCINTGIMYPDEGYVQFSGEFITIYNIILNLIGDTYISELYEISTNFTTQFCLIYTIDKKNSNLLTEDMSKKLISLDQYFKIESHPILYEDHETQDLILNSHFERYRKISINSQLFDQQILLTIKFRFAVICGNNELIISRIEEFKKIFHYVDYCLRKKLPIKGILENEMDRFIEQYLYIDLQQDIYGLKEKILLSDVTDYREIFHFLDKVGKKSLWFIYTIDSQYNLEKWRRIFEVSRLFLYEKIGIEQFDWLHQMFPYTKEDRLLANLYNLVLGKFSLAYVKIGTQYLTEGYHLLLKTIFRNFWMQTLDENLESFLINKEASNYIKPYEISDDIIIEDIFNGEGINIEFKSSFLFDWKEYIKTNNSTKMNSISVIKPIVAMLNSQGGTIIVGIREYHKVLEEIKKETFTVQDLENIDLRNPSKINGHYLTGIEKDLSILNQNEDQCVQYLDSYIKQHIYPDPFINNDAIRIVFKKILGKMIGIIEVPSSKNEYYLIKKDKDITTYELYIRHNSSDQKINTPKDAIEYFKSKSASTPLSSLTQSP